MGLPVASHPLILPAPGGVPRCIFSPHGSQCEAVGQVWVVRQQCGKQVAGTGVHGYALPEQHFSEATERTPCGGNPSSTPRYGCVSPLPRGPHIPVGYGPPQDRVVGAREVPGVGSRAETKTRTGKSKGKRPLGPLGRGRTQTQAVARVKAGLHLFWGRGQTSFPKW